MQTPRSEPPANNKAALSLMDASKAVFECEDFRSAAAIIFDSCKSLLGATAGYVALLNEEGTENEVLFLDSGGTRCTVDPSLPMPIRGLRQQAYATGTPVYENDFMSSEWIDFMPPGHSPLHNVLFSPIIVDGKTIGLIGLGNKSSGFDAGDVAYAASFGQLAATALRNALVVERLRETESRLWDLLENAETVARDERTRARTYLDAAGTVMFVLRPDGIVMYGNQEACGLLGKDVDDLRGRDWFEVAFDAEDRRIAREGFDSFLRDGAGGIPELPMRTASGSNKTISWRTVATTDGSDEMAAVICTGYDVTERNAFIEALARSESMLQEAQAIARLGWCTMDMTTYTYERSAQLEAILGIDEDYPRTVQSLISLIHPEDSEWVSRVGIGDTSELVDIEFRIVRHDDSQTRWVHVISHIVTSPLGPRAAVTVRDITSQREAEDALRTYQRRLSEMAAEVVAIGENERREIATELHDVVGQELAVAKMTLQQLLRDCDDSLCEAEVRKTLWLIEEAIRGIRAVSSELSPAPLYELGLGPAVDSLCEQFAEHFGLTCEMEIDPSLGELKTEAGNLAYRSVRELLNNVQRHSGASNARVIITSSNDSIVACVADDGCGFSPDLATIVQCGRFGLFSVDEQVALKGGTMTIESAAGEGTRVLVRIPFID